MAAECGTASQLDGSDNLWRSLHNDLDHLEWFEDEQRWIPAGQNLQFDDDGCSLQWREHLEDIHSLGPGAVITPTRPLVGEIGVKDVRDFGFGAQHNPVGDTPIDCAHSLITWPDGQTPTKDVRRELRSDLAQAFTLVHGVVTQSPPPGA